MADILAALGQLEEEETKQRGARQQKNGKSKKKTPKDIATQNAKKNAGRRSRATSNVSERSSAVSLSGVDRPLSSGYNLRTPQDSTYALPEPSPSQGPDSARRISFANTPRPGGNKIWIPTRTDSLASGFPYDMRLNKYRVPEEEWDDFNKELLEAANVSGPTWMWLFRKKEVIKRIRRDLQFDGNVARVFKKWNRLFKRQRFQAWLELPGQKSDDSEEEVDDKVHMKRFRVVISQNSEQRAPSVYSRNSSMTRSVTGEGVTAAMARKTTEDEDTS